MSLHFVKQFLESSAVLQLGQLETLQSTFAGGAGGSLGPQGVSSMSQPSSLLCWERAGAVCGVSVGQRAQQLHDAAGAYGFAAVVGGAHGVVGCRVSS